MKAISTNKSISRREFLKVSGLAMVGILGSPGINIQVISKLQLRQDIHSALEAVQGAGLRELTGFQQWSALNQGRVIDSYTDVHTEPDFNAPTVKLMWKDTVVPIMGVHYNELTDSHNQVWYQVGDAEYIHSGVIQPVSTTPSLPVADIPPGGQLAEVCVPYTDAYWAMGKNQPLAYRLYFQTTHWVNHLEYGQDNEPWYMIMEDKWELHYYVPASHLRLIQPEEVTPLSPGMPNTFKKLEIHLPEQLMIAYEQNTPVFMARVATGGRFRDGDFTTPTGHYLTYHKRPSRHMAAGNLAAGGYDLPGVPWISYFTESGVSIHGTYWHNNYGRPRSHGCINMTPLAAKWIYRWTQPEVPHDKQMVYRDFGTSLNIFGD
jgi:hypothetical protein